ncbi:MAG: hypothetical protein ACREBD_00035 [Blastocatellia bacterium]
MSNWQFIIIIATFALSVFGFILTIFGAIRSLQTSISEQFTAFRSEMRAELTRVESGLRAELARVESSLKNEIETLRNEIRNNDKRYEERFAHIEADIREIKSVLAVHSEQFVKLNEQLVRLNEQFASFRNELEALRHETRQGDKRYEDRFARLEADVREIKSDLNQVLKPTLAA